MTDKDLKKIERLFERVVHDILETNYGSDDEPTIPVKIIDEMEAYMGESIMFMGIS